MNPWQWFLAHGDKLLATLTAWLSSPQGQSAIPSAWAPTIAGVLTLVHLLFLPEPSSAPTVATPTATGKQSGRTSLTFLAMVLAIVLAACATFGGLSLDEKLGAAQISVTNVVKAATTAVQAGTLSSANAQSVLNMAQGAKDIIATARADEAAGNTTGASTELTLATSALTALQTFLNDKAGAAAQPPPAAPQPAVGPKTSYYARDPAEPFLACTES